MKKEIVVEANSSQEAIDIALERLRVKKHEVEIKVLSEGKQGLFGMEGSKKAKVKVIRKRWKNNSSIKEI